MGQKYFVSLTATVATVAFLGGCAAPTQESCALSPNQTLGGAIIGAGVGTAVGALASRGSAGGMLVGAAVGMLVGAAVGQQQDQACYQMALRTAFQQAEADRRAYEAALAQAEAARQAEAAEQAELARQAAARRAASRQAAAVQPATSEPMQAPPPAQYRPVAWRSQGTGNGGTITPTNNFTDQASGRNCWSFEDRPLAADGTSGAPVTRRACMGADGNVVPVN